MHVVVRRYGRASGLIEAMTAKSDEVTELISGVPGFVSYHATRTDDGGMITVTVCQDREGTDESSRRAAEWVAANAADTGLTPVERSEGSTFLSF